MIDQEQLDKIEKYLKTSITIREPKSKKAFCKSIGITVPTFNKYEELFKQGRKLKSETNHTELDELPIEEKIKIFDRLLFQLVQDPKTPSKDRELFAKRYGLLVDKTETKVKISADADELARIESEAERRARAFREQNRTPSLQERPSLLPAEIREDT
jgi:hypothetical protein